MHTLTQGQQRCQCCPDPLEGQGTQTLCPDKDQCLGKQSSGKSLLNTFHCKNNRTGSDPGCPCKQPQSRAVTWPQLLPALCPASMGHQDAKPELRGPMASAAAPSAHRDSPTPHAVAGSRQEDLVPLSEPLQGWLFFASSRNKGAPFMQAFVFPAIGLVTERSNSQIE